LFLRPILSGSVSQNPTGLLVSFFPSVLLLLLHSLAAARVKFLDLSCFPVGVGVSASKPPQPPPPKTHQNNPTTSILPYPPIKNPQPNHPNPKKKTPPPPTTPQKTPPPPPKTPPPHPQKPKINPPPTQPPPTQCNSSPSFSSCLVLSRFHVTPLEPRLFPWGLPQFLLSVHFLRIDSKNPFLCVWTF